MTLILVRHGRTVTNAEGRLLGRADPPLDDVGREQAAALNLGPAARVISSPLRRARETAAIIASDSVSVEIDERWIEIDYGSLEGARLTEVPADLWTQWRADIRFEPPGGGESLHALGARVREACDELLAQGAEHEGDIIVVTHVSPIKAATAWALGVGDEVVWRMYVAPASVTRIDARPQGPVLLGFNSPV